MSLFRIVFVHGYTASSRVDWYPDIAPKLKELGIDFAIPDLPGGKHPHVAEWLAKIQDVVSAKSKPLVFVGHSLGTRAVLLYLEKYRPKIERVFLIAAFANRVENAKRKGGDAYPDFFDHTVDVEKIKPLANKLVVMHSKDDSSIPYEQGKEIAHELGAELITYENRDHFSEPENADEIFRALSEKLDLEALSNVSRH